MCVYIYIVACARRKIKENPKQYTLRSDNGTIKISLIDGTVKCFNLNTCPTTEEMGHQEDFT